MFQLFPEIQNYKWGKIGFDSIISKFYKTIEPSKPYAELWIGTHHKAETNVIINNKKIPLSKFLGYKLPFLFKILSVKKPLSIQIHPDKETAKKMSREFKEVYSDSNHKPEMFYTLSKFELLCGFRENNEIKRLLHPFLHIFLKFNINIILQNDEDLKRLFSTIMKTNKLVIKQIIQYIILNITLLKNSKLEKFIIYINRQYPFDVGVLALFFLNHIKLPPNEILYLRPNVPHSYLSGDCLEIMVSSNNVIRCGLTPKFRDVDLLCEILDYSFKLPERVNSICNNCGLFEPTSDFGLMVFENKKNILPCLWGIDTNSPIIMLVLEAEEGCLCDNIPIITGNSYLLMKSGYIFTGYCKIVYAYKPNEIIEQEQKIPDPPENTPDIPIQPPNTPHNSHSQILFTTDVEIINDNINDNIIENPEIITNNNYVDIDYSNIEIISLYDDNDN